MASRVERLEEAAAEDKGGRGIGPLLRVGELQDATSSLRHVRHIAILTGYPCCSSSPPTETDGPPGALAIARALMRMGKRVVLMTDEVNRGPVVAAEEEERRSYGCQAVPVLSFPGGAIEADELVESLDLDCLIAIERTGPAEDGGYYTMRGRDMALSVPIAKLESLFTATRKDGRRLVTIVLLLPRPLLLSLHGQGVGDGGNEVGMGKRIKLVRAHVPLGDKIACTVKVRPRCCGRTYRRLAGGTPPGRGSLELGRMGACARPYDEQGCFHPASSSPLAALPLDPLLPSLPLSSL
eukprot:756692-Hanusia_phi.AAC.3